MVDIDSSALVTAYNLVSERYAEVLASTSPDYQIDGQVVNKGKYLEQLAATQAHLLAQIKDTQTPFEVHEEIIT